MLFYRSLGDPKNQPLIFLHGFLGSSLDFLPLMQKLQKKYFCISLDLPAHGNSPYEPNILLALQKTIESIAKNPILLGYSLGGRVALHLNQKLDLPLKAIILLSSHIGLSCPIQKKTRLENDLLWCEKLKTLSPPNFLKAWYQQPVFTSLQKKPKLLKELMEKRLYQNPEELALVLEEMSLAHQPLLNTFPSPTYVLYGEEDTKIKDLYQTQPIQKVEIKKAGHVIHLENPGSCIKAIESFYL